MFVFFQFLVSVFLINFSPELSEKPTIGIIKHTTGLNVGAWVSNSESYWNFALLAFLPQ